MIALHWLHPALGSGPVCYICGQAAELSQPVQAALADTFMDHDLALAPTSPVVCVPCATLFKADTWRRRHWWLTPTSVTEWTREAMRTTIADWFVSPYPVIAVVALTKKKWRPLLTARASYRETLTIQFELQRVTVDAPTWHHVLGHLDALLALGHTRTEVLTGDLHLTTMKKHGQLRTVMQHMTALSPYHGTPLLAFVSYATPTLNEKEETNDEPTDRLPRRGRGLVSSPVDGDSERSTDDLWGGHLDATASNSDIGVSARGDDSSPMQSCLFAVR